MIINLSELQDYTRRLAVKFPALKDEILLRSPGCTGVECGRLKDSLPDLPGSYIECVQKFDLLGVAIGYFQLSTGRFTGYSFVDGLISTNSLDKNPLLPFLRSNGLYEVGAYEADPICVSTRKSRYAEGMVLRLSPPELISRIMPLADNFEEFMLLVGNLDAIREKYSKSMNGINAVEEFIGILRNMQVSGEALASWRIISEVVLSA
jgi:hypothetical protein